LLLRPRIDRSGAAQRIRKTSASGKAEYGQ